MQDNALQCSTMNIHRPRYCTGLTGHCVTTHSLRVQLYSAIPCTIAMPSPGRKVDCSAMYTCRSRLGQRFLRAQHSWVDLRAVLCITLILQLYYSWLGQRLQLGGFEGSAVKYIYTWLGQRVWTRVGWIWGRAQQKLPPSSQTNHCHSPAYTQLH